MKLPKTLKIAGHTYKIFFPYKFNKKIRLLGECDVNSLTIKVADRDKEGIKLNNSTIKIIFLHEVLHAISFHYNCEINKERDIRSLSEGVFQVFKDNKIL